MLHIKEKVCSNNAQTKKAIKTSFFLEKLHNIVHNQITVPLQKLSISSQAQVVHLGQEA